MREEIGNFSRLNYKNKSNKSLEKSVSEMKNSLDGFNNRLDTEGQ